MPGEDVATEVVAKSFDSMGPAAGMFLLLLAIVVGMFYLASIHLKKNGKKDAPKQVVVDRMSEPSWFDRAVSMADLRREQSKDDESQNDRLDRIEAALWALEDRVESRRIKDEAQDERLSQMRSDLAMIQGMIKARAGQTGVTHFLPQDDE